MAINSELQVRIEWMARQLCDAAGEVDESEGDCWLDAVENRAIEMADALAAEVVKQQSANRRPADEAICPDCGQAGHCRGTRERELITRRGPTTIVEPECYCPACRRAFFPALERVRG
jgi:hypothetical protein